MSTSYDLGDVDSVIPLTIGPSGERQFFIDVVHGSGALRFPCEKGHVQVLSAHLLRLAEASGVGGTAAEPAEPDDTAIAWHVGRLIVTIDATTGHINVMLVEFPFTTHPSEVGDSLATARFSVSPAQARSFATHAALLLAGSRTLCRRCGRPIEADGHDCPRLN